MIYIGIVQWFDAAEPLPDKISEKCGLDYLTVWSVGIIAEETDDSITLARDYFEGSESTVEAVRRRIVIPKISIRRIVRLSMEV